MAWEKKDWKPFKPPRRQEGLKWPQNTLDPTPDWPISGLQLNSNLSLSWPQLYPDWTLTVPWLAPTGPQLNPNLNPIWLQLYRNWTATGPQLDPEWTQMKLKLLSIEIHEKLGDTDTIATLLVV